MSEKDLTSSPPKRGQNRAAKAPQRLSRSEKAQRIRNDLLHAAAQAIGENGYLNAMIQAITSKANLANGTFYNYFTSQQDLFDQLLPMLGREMLDFIRTRNIEGSNEIDREVARFNAFFDYLKLHPEFYRVLYEGEVFAQEAFDLHMNQVMKGYGGILRRAANAGDITGYSSHELDVLALILMGARHYIAMRYMRQDGGDGHIPEWVTDTYRKFIAGGLKAISQEAQE